MWHSTSTPPAVVIRRARLGLGGPRSDVILRADVVAGTDGPVEPGALVVDGSAGTLLPGLVDHHIHLGAWLRARRSTPVGPDGLAATLAATRADGRGWRVLFGLDHQHDMRETMTAVDAVAGPSVVVHRTGHACVLNAAAARALGVGGRTVLHHGRGVWGRALGPADTGWERERLRALAADLLAQGVVAVQDATPYPSGAGGRTRMLREALAPVRVDFMADPRTPLAGARWTKLFDVADVPAGDGPLAVHAVEPAEVVAALDLLATRPPAAKTPHRIEHAALCPPEIAERVAAAGHDVCANPGFLSERATALAPLRRTGEDVFLHPVADLHELGVPLRFGSDAPVTSPGVWSAVDAARRRGDPSVPFAGRSMTLAAALSAVVSFAMPATAEAWLGQPADLALIDDVALRGASGPAPAIATFVGGIPVFTR